ncbi:MAG: RNA 2'-phosphotransferase [Neisseria sp.]|nr:RNA 2'-phosphotransferase [Neisseria sp.]
MESNKLNDQQRKSISKFLSLILRHRPEQIGLELDKNGWADIGGLLEKANRNNRTGLCITREVLMEVVETNDKKRFTISEDGSRIRAAQGHSTQQVQIEHRAAEPPALLYHGTAEKHLPSIRGQGLHGAGRHYVHLSADEATAVKVGARHGKPVVLHIDTAAMRSAGMAFYLADNGVWLTEAVPPQYIRFP